MNTAIVLGTVTKDIELKYPNSGRAIVNFSIAYNKKYKGADGKLVEKVSFFEVSAFGKSAETINSYFHKGSRILVTGELEQSSWTGQDGSKKRKVSIRLEKFDFIDKTERQNNSHYQPQRELAQQSSPAPTYRQPQRELAQQSSPAPTYRQPQQAPEVAVDDSEIPF